MTTFNRSIFSLKNVRFNSTVQKIPKLNMEKLTKNQRKALESMIRVNQAGELGAVRIYQGQLAVLGRTKDGPVLKHMLEHERKHFDTFNKIVAENGVRPTVFWPFWNVAGVALGAGTAMMGREAAMLCTEAVETVIGEHYNDQIRMILEMDKDQSPELKEMRDICQKFRDEELEHLDHAVANDSQKAPFREALSAVIKGGCHAAIWISKRF